MDEFEAFCSQVDEEFDEFNPEFLEDYADIALAMNENKENYEDFPLSCYLDTHDKDY